MKTLIPAFCAFILCGCAMGINHNTTSINGKPYLVETKTYGFLFEAWSKPSTLIPLEEEKEVVMPENYNPSTARAELARIADECNIRSIKAQSRPLWKNSFTDKEEEKLSEAKEKLQQIEQAGNDWYAVYGTEIREDLADYPSWIRAN